MKTLRSIVTGAGLAAIILGSASVGAHDRADPTLEQIFDRPPREARPRLRWWWPGGAVNDEELARELALMAAAGFGGAEIQAFNTGIPDLTPSERATINQYATPPFFAHVRKAGERAAALGLNLDYTFGSAWPSGGGFAIPPEKALVELTMARTEVRGGQAGPLKVAIPPRTRRFGALSTLDARVRDPRAAGWIERFDARQKIVAVVAMKGSAPTLKEAADVSGFKLFPWRDVTVPGTLDPASAVILTDRLKDDGSLDWTPPPGTWQIVVFKQYASNMGVSGAAGEGPQLTLDHMDPAAFAAHAARVGDPLGVRPPGLRATFVDSLELMQDIAWGNRFLTEFKARRGYDLTPYLPFVLQPGWMQAWDEHWSPPYFEAAGGETGERVRADFRRTVSDLMFAGFIDPFVAWNHAHGVKAKFQAHGGAIDVIRGYGAVDIPETEDLVGGGDPYFMRLARSGADLYGRPIVSAESLVWKDRPYDVTPDELRQRADLLFAGGVNQLNIHGFNYIRGQQWPGSHAFQPSGFSLGFSTMVNPTNPIWAGIPTLVGYFSRLQAVLQAGRPIVPVAYFYGSIGYYPGIEDKGARAHAAEKAFLAGGYDYDRINPDALQAARVVGRQLVAKGGQRYGALVLPPLNAMRAESAEAIAGFARAGLPVIFTGVAPSRDEGLADARARDARVKAAIAAAIKAGARVSPERATVDALRGAGVRGNLRFTGADPSGLVFVQRRAGGKIVTFIHNTASDARDAGVILPAHGGVERWDAMRGGRVPIDAHSVDGGTAATLALAAGQSALIILDPNTKPVAVTPPKSIARTDVSQGWTLSISGHSPRTTEIRRALGPTGLGDWRKIDGLATFAGVGTYHRIVEVPTTWFSRGSRVVFDLGQVHDMATVTVNGHSLPPALGAPFRVDITDVAQPGKNVIDVAVATTPQNAMIDPKAAGYKNLRSVPTGMTGPVMIELTR
jgi:hypothetical protein